MSSFTNNQAIYPSLKGKTAFVTGGATGIGAVIVKQLCYQGVSVTFVDIDRENSEKVAANLTELGHNVNFVYCDITNIESLKNAITNTATEFGGLDILVNNAANDERHNIAEIDECYWDQSIAINLKPYFFAAQTAHPFMKENGGSIINLGSASWRRKQPGMPLYTTAKAAIEGLTRSLASNLGNDFIRVNTLIPGWVKTDKQIAKWLSPDAAEKTQEAQCIHKALEPIDIAKATLFLASDDSQMMTATTLIIDAGWI